MSLEIIPEKTTTVCDECGARSDNVHGPRFRMRAHVEFKGHALDIYGDPAASADFSFDLCDKCAVVFYNKWRARGTGV